MHSPIVVFGAAIAVSLAVSACDFTEEKKPGNGHGGQAPANRDPTDSVLTEPAFNRLQVQLFRPFCIACHDGARHSGGVDLETHGSVMQARDSAGNLVVMPGDGAASKLYSIITSGRMPPGASKPDAEITAALRRWIDAGADEHAPDVRPMPPRTYVRSAEIVDDGDVIDTTTPDSPARSLSGEDP